MPIQTTIDLVKQLFLIDIGLAGTLHVATFAVVGTITPEINLHWAQWVLLGLNAVLIVFRVAQILKNWNKGKNG